MKHPIEWSVDAMNSGVVGLKLGAEVVGLSL